MKIIYSQDDCSVIRGLTARMGGYKTTGVRDFIILCVAKENYGI